jgi:hypothetical protein
MRHWFGRRGNFLVFLLSEKEPFAASLSRRGPRVTAHHNLYSTEKMYNERDGSETAGEEFLMLPTSRVVEVSGRPLKMS